MLAEKNFRRLRTLTIFYLLDLGNWFNLLPKVKNIFLLTLLVKQLFNNVTYISWIGILYGCIIDMNCQIHRMCIRHPRHLNQYFFSLFSTANCLIISILYMNGANVHNLAKCLYLLNTLTFITCHV